ncbi:class C beta-lactamase-related serine hydrolase [Rhodobacteraceae bacterium RKSG542]|uniref:serine hydrolase domain-containing protein n=1 Tax=Pseudovibrio flavus TaxID=2529854 RepID=UPI0012BCDD1F|nr:serine hydrolase [Pseudovibrio flavus]MTI18030.1 class C beta-lactamase-related serine hydrolase [Pseudovibrio flavus]
MLRSLVLASCVITVTGASALELKPADQAFLDQIAPFGVSQAHWDAAEFAALTFPNAYKFTRHYEIDRGTAVSPQKWIDDRGALDLTKLTGHDADGPLPLDVLLRDRVKNHSMVVLKGDRLIHEHYFNGMSPASTHLDMSVTKSFTATLAGIAAADGKLDMTKPVEFYLPAFKGSAFEGVSVQDVADMNSGLDIPTPPFLSWDPKFTLSQEWNGPNDGGLNGIDEYLVTIKKHKYEPGTHYQYQDPNTEVLGLVVEAATKQGLAEYLQEKIWTKIGAEQNAYWMADPKGYTVASGGLNMATRDLARVGKVFLNSGKNHLGEEVVPQAFIDAIWAGNERVKAAWSVGKEAALAPDGWYKDQIRILTLDGHKVMVFVGIHGQVCVMDPETDVVIAMNGGYPQTETARMNTMIFLETVPTILKAAAKL